MTTSIIAAMILGCGVAQNSFAIDETLPGYVTHVSNDRLDIAVVDEHHLKPGDTGVIVRKGQEVCYVQVTGADARDIHLQILSQTSGVELAVGDSIVFESRVHASSKEDYAKWNALDKLILGGTLEQPATYQVSVPWERLPFENPSTMTIVQRGFRLGPSAPLAADNLMGPPLASSRTNEMTAMPSTPVDTGQAPPPSSSSASVPVSTLKTGTSDNDFAPILVPLSISPSAKTANFRDSNIFHGQLRNRESFQAVPNPATHTLESRLDNDGSIERLYASRWSLAWSGNLSYRDGNTGQSSPDFEQPKLNIYSAMFSRKNDDGGTLKAGRFLPSQLPGLGFLDGGQLEHVYSPQWRAGGVLAFRPNRINLEPATKEPLMSAYASTEQGTQGNLYYSGSFGLYQTFYRGISDELALLLDHRADLGPKLSLFATSQIDFNGGAQQVHKGPRLIRLDTFANSPVAQNISMRVGLSHYERPDDAAERDLTAGTTLGFDTGFWRYFWGANERLPWRFTLDEEISVINSETAPTDQLWRVTLSRFGFFFLPNGQLLLSVYNVTAGQGNGLGFQGTASTPLWTDKLSLSLSSSSQYSTPASSPKTYNVNDASVRLNWRISKSWNADFGATQSYAGGAVTSTVADTSVGYRW